MNNMWLESIANIQRQRPPPRDIDLESELIGPLYACGQCGEEKTEAGYYIRTNRSTGITRRSSICKACELAKERDYRARLAKPKPMPIEEMIIGALSMKAMIVSDLATAVGRHRRAVEKALAKLIEAEIVEQRGYVVKKYHPRVMTYRLTQARPGAGERNAAL